MKISLRVDAKQCVCELLTIINFFDKQRDSVSYFRFPFTHGMPIEVMRAMVVKELKTIEFRTRVCEVKRMWRKMGTHAIRGVEEVAHRHGVDVIPEYICYLTTIGPYGYFETPHIVFVNIIDSNVYHATETIVHEVLHLVLYEKVKHLTHEQREKLIDRQFSIGILKELFPAYNQSTR